MGIGRRHRTAARPGIVFWNFTESRRIGAPVPVWAGWTRLARRQNFTARYGRTALMWACEKGHIEAARLLVDKGADLNAKDTESAWTFVFPVSP